MHFLTFFASAGLVHLGIAGYTLEDNYSADTFFSMFNFSIQNDSTGGYVDYVDQADAQSSGLINTNNGQVYIGVDHTNVATGRGRSSVRIESKKQYTHGLVVLDLAHMPGGICGTWPAFWMYGPNWPNSGEIDIIEGVNDQSVNLMTLHTDSGCSISSSAELFTGTSSTTNCWVDEPSQSPNQGCSISATNTGSYGTAFNNHGGGVYAMEWTSAAISIWFWPAGHAPSDALGATPNPAGWGKPTSVFTGFCNIDKYFMNNWIVFDNTFCGSWAGAAWSGNCAASHGASCNSFVQNTPGAFQDAYWLINSLKVYQDNGDPGLVPAPAPAPGPTLSAAPVSVSASAPPTQTATQNPSPVSPAEVTVTALDSDEFGVGSNGIPDRRARRHKRHMARHIQAAKGHA